MNRREFLATAGAAAAGLACQAPRNGVQAGGASARPLDRIGIQLYTLRREMQRDVDATLARVAAIGYREVEFAGYFGQSPAQTRALLARHGLTAPSTHVAYDATGPAWERALDDASARGHAFVTVPWLPADVRRSASTWRQVAERFNRAGEAARSRGLAFAYHNHDFEFVRVDGRIPFDLLLQDTDPALVSFQMDVYWVVKGGGNPLAYLRAHPTRFSMLHVKDSGGPPAHAQVDVGAGVIDFASILRLDAGQRRSIRHLFVEHDQPADPFRFAEQSLSHLRTLEY